MGSSLSRLSQIAAIAAVGLLLAAPRCSYPEVSIAVFGDSHSDADRTPRRDWLEFAPDPLQIDEHAIRGEKCWQIVPRFLDVVEELDQDVVVIFCGTNDVLRDDWGLQRTFSEIELATNVAQLHGLGVVLVAPPPAFRDDDVDFEVANERLLALRDELQVLGERSGVVVADLWDALWAELAKNPMRYVDRLHLDVSGRRVMSSEISRAVLEAYGES